MNRNAMINRLAWFSLLVLTLVVPPLHAESRLYDVEVIIFSRGGSGTDDETPGQSGIDAVRATGTFPAGEFTELSSGAYQLNNISGGLAAASGYHVLFHRAWRQPAYERSNAVDYPVHTSAGSGRNSVEGTIALVKERYLHLYVDLLLKTAGSTAPGLYSDGSGSRPAFRLTEKRRIRSGELHYFDHPRFGMIARVTPYAAPDEPATSGPVEEAAPDDAAGNSQEEEPVTADDQLTR